VADTTITPGSGGLVLAASRPGVNNIDADPPAGSLVVSGAEPIVGGSYWITPDAAEVEFTGYPPRLKFILSPAEYVFMAELTAAVDDIGTLETFYVTDGAGWVTRPDDAPANTHVQPVLTNPCTYRREMFSGNAVFGYMRPSFGEAVLSNMDGRFDGWKFYGFDGRDYTVYAGRHGARFPGEWVTVLKANIESVNVDLREVRIKLRDYAHYLEQPILRDKFAGTGGLEGEEQIAGQPKPRLFGYVPWFPPVPIVITDGDYTYEPILVSGGRWQPQGFKQTISQYDSALTAVVSPSNVAFDLTANGSKATFANNGFWAYYTGTIATIDFTILRASSTEEGVQTIGSLTFTDGSYVGVFTLDEEIVLEANDQVFIVLTTEDIWNGDVLPLLNLTIALDGEFTTAAASTFVADPT